MSSIQIIPVHAQNDLVFAFDMVHGDYDSVIGDYVAGKGWDILQIDRPLTLQYLMDNNVKVLHLSQFEKVFTDQEIRELKEFVDSGGIIMLATYSETTEYWEEFTREFGITYLDYVNHKDDGFWLQEVANHPLLEGVGTLDMPFRLPLLKIESPSTTLITTDQSGTRGPIVALYESNGILLVYPAENYYTNRLIERAYNLDADNYLFLGNALRWFGETETVVPRYVTTTTETRTVTSVSTTTQTTRETMTSTTTLTATTSVYRTTTSTTTSTSTVAIYRTSTSLVTTTVMKTSTDYVNTAVLLQGNNLVIGSETAAGIVLVIVISAITLFLLIKRTMNKNIIKLKTTEH